MLVIKLFLKIVTTESEHLQKEMSSVFWYAVVCTYYKEGRLVDPMAGVMSAQGSLMCLESEGSPFWSHLTSWW